MTVTMIVNQLPVMVMKGGTTTTMSNWSTVDRNSNGKEKPTTTKLLLKANISHFGQTGRNTADAISFATSTITTHTLMIVQTEWFITSCRTLVFSPATSLDSHSFRHSLPLSWVASQLLLVDFSSFYFFTILLYSIPSLYTYISSFKFRDLQRKTNST